MDTFLNLALSLVLLATATQGFPETLAGDDPYTISEPCSQHLQLYQNSSTTELWAMQMFDSWTKFPSGLLYGVYMDLGNYDECVGLKDVPSPSGVFGGKYCLASVFPTPETPEEANEMVKVLKQRQNRLTAIGGVPVSMPIPSAVSLMGAVCLPSSCSPADFMNYLNVNFSQGLQFLPIPRLSFYTEDKYCNDGTYDAFRPIDWGAVAFLVIFALFAIFSTAYDLRSQKSASRIDILLAFSWYTNGKKLFSTQKSTQDISCLHGIRFLSILWVVLGHRYYLNSTMPNTNSAQYNKQIVTWEYLFIQSGDLSVDSFFLLSGVLVAYVFLNGVHRGARFNIVLFYFHRYIRLTPALAAMIFMDVSLIKYTSSGPLWKAYSTSSCNELWWKNLLYINNYFDLDKSCIGQSWYLAADMQLYWLSPLVLIPLWKKPKIGKMLLGFFTVAGLATCFGICYHYEIMPIIKSFITNDVESSVNYNHYYYYSTHTRLTPWLVGIAFGYVLHEVKKQSSGTITLSMVQWIALWCFAAFFMLVTLCGVFPLDQIDHEFNAVEFTFYNTFHRPVWALGLGLMIFVCSTGYGGPVNTFLSWSFFLPLSRLTYGIYLIHITMQYIISLPIRTLMFDNDLTMICETIADLILSALIAIVFCLLFESPFIVLEKVILGFFGVGRSSNRTTPPMDRMTPPTEKKQDLESGATKGKESEGLPSEKASIVEEHTCQKGNSLERGEKVDVSSTVNLLPH